MNWITIKRVHSFYTTVNYMDSLRIPFAMFPIPNPDGSPSQIWDLQIDKDDLPKIDLEELI